MPTEVIPFEGIDKLGLFVDTPSIALPPGAFSDVLNVRFDDGSIRKVRGHTEIFNTLALTDIQYIAYWPNPNRPVWIAVNRTNDRDFLFAIQIVAGALTATDLSQGTNGYAPSDNWQHTLFNGGYTIILNSGNDIPQHATDAQGNDTLPDFADLPGWQSYNNSEGEDITAVTAGIILSFGNVLLAGDLEETRNNSIARSIASVDRSGGGATITLTEALPLTIVDPGTFTTGGMSFDWLGGDPDRIRVSLDPGQADDPALLVEGAVLRFGTGGTITRDLRGVVRSSNIAAPGSIPTIWNPFTVGAGTADEIIIADTGEITAMQTLQGRVMVYTANSIAQLSVTPQGLSEINITRQYGALSFGTVFEFDGRHIVLGSNDIYTFSGHPSSIQSLADGRVRRFYYDDVHSESTANTVIVRNQTFDEVWICYRSQANPVNAFDRALTWNYRDNTWSRRSLPNLLTLDVGPITGGGVASTELTFGGDATGDTFAGTAEVQRVNYTGTRSNVVPTANTVEIALPSDFNSGGASFNVNGTSGTVGTRTAVNGIEVIIDNGVTYPGREQVVLAQANNGGSVSNPDTATFNIRTGVNRVNWSGGTSSTEVAPYRVFTSTGGAAGTRVTGGSSTRFPGGYAGFDEGALTGGAALSATNIPNPIALPAGSAVGGVTTDAGGSPVLASYIGGIQESTNTAIRMAVVHGRGRNFAYNGEGGSAFTQRLYFLNSGASGIRVILQGPNVTYNGRRARLRNTNSYPVTVTGSWGNITLAPNEESGRISVNAQTITWTANVTPGTASYLFDPDITDTHITSSVPTTLFAANQNANQALQTLGTAIAALDPTISFSGTNPITITFDDSVVTAPISHLLTITANSGTNTAPTLTERDTLDQTNASVYTVRDYRNRQVTTFTSGVGVATDSDLDTVNTTIINAINNPLTPETPIDFTAVLNTTDTRIDITAQVVGRVFGTDGMPTGRWSITADHGASTGSEFISFTYDATNSVLGEDASVPSVVTITTTTQGGVTEDNILTLTDSSNPTSVATQVTDFLNSPRFPIHAATRTGAVITVEPLALGAASEDITVAYSRIGTNRRQASRDTTIPAPTVVVAESGENDVERPWSTLFINEGINFVLGATADSFLSQDVTYGANGLPLLSYIERKNIHVRPTKDTEMIQTFFLDTMGDPRLDDLDADSMFTLRLNVTNAAGQANGVVLDNDTGNTIYDFDYNGNDSDYKVDTRLTGRILNYRIEDNSTNGWSIAGIAMEVGKGGTR